MKQPFRLDEFSIGQLYRPITNKDNLHFHSYTLIIISLCCQLCFKHKTNKSKREREILTRYVISYAAKPEFHLL